MSRMYTLVFRGIAATAVQDIFEVTPADDKPVRIAGLFLSQDTDAGDAEEEVLDLRIRRGNTTSGSGGAAVTPEAINPSDAAAGATAERNNTTQASAGTVDELHADAWNVRVPYQMWWPEDTRPMATQGNTTMCVSLETAPADSITISGTLYIEEM